MVWAKSSRVPAAHTYTKAVYTCIKLGQGHWDACVGTWDLGSRDEGLGDIKYGTRRRVGLGHRNSSTRMRECE